MRPFAYERPESITAALTRLDGDADGSSVRPLAGGTDLLTLMKADLVTPDTLVDIKQIAELDDRIEAAAEGVSIGALTTLAQLESHPLILSDFTALADSAGQAASPQLRNMATIGGNILQRPRCWYFRDPSISCWLKGGDTCPARDGENAHHAIFQESPCVAVHPSDSAAALIALGASVRIRGAAGERTLPVAEFFTLPTDDHRLENVLRPGELVVGFTLPAPSAGSRSVYLKAMDRKSWAFALIGVAASVTVDGGRITDARVVLSAVEPVPRRLVAVEDSLRGSAPSAELFRRMGALAVAGAQPLRQNGYKLDLARTLVARALADASSPAA